MKIEHIRIQSSGSQASQSANDPFDIDVKVKSIRPIETGVNQAAITSKSLCTPGCGMTGTGNSFCC
jgi:gallidermin/nisin family lantibiotic